MLYMLLYILCPVLLIKQKVEPSTLCPAYQTKSCSTLTPYVLHIEQKFAWTFHPVLHIKQKLVRPPYFLYMHLFFNLYWRFSASWRRRSRRSSNSGFLGATGGLGNKISPWSNHSWTLNSWLSKFLHSRKNFALQMPVFWQNFHWLFISASSKDSFGLINFESSFSFEFGKRTWTSIFFLSNLKKRKFSKTEISFFFNFN